VLSDIPVARICVLCEWSRKMTEAQQESMSVTFQDIHTEEESNRDGIVDSIGIHFDDFDSTTIVN